MNEKLKIPIIVIGFNRTFSLMRILKSLNKAKYDHPVDLIISIDHYDNNEVLKIAEEFTWKNGEKKVIPHPQRLGLKDHLLFCGDLTERYDGVIILEDDLYVSPYFYDFSVKAIQFFGDDPHIAGISLFSHHFNENAYLPFIPLNQQADVFFIQLPSSWGQCWTGKQWLEFRKWYREHDDGNRLDHLMVPESILSWPKTSWKKYFCMYMVEMNKYFVYPYLSLTSNFADIGTHFEKREYIFQRPLQYFKKDYIFKDFNHSIAVYDSFCEILPDRLKVLCPHLQQFNFEMDLYGSKPLDKIQKEYLLSTKACESSIISYGREMKPVEANVIEERDGTVIRLGKRDSFRPRELRKYGLDDILYYYDFVEWLHLKNLIKDLTRTILPVTAISGNKHHIVSNGNQVKHIRIKFFFGRLLNFIRLHKFRVPVVILKEFIFKSSRK